MLIQDFFFPFSLSCLLRVWTDTQRLHQFLHTKDASVDQYRIDLKNDQGYTGLSCICYKHEFAQKWPRIIGPNELEIEVIQKAQEKCLNTTFPPVQGPSTAAFWITGMLGLSFLFKSLTLYLFTPAKFWNKLQHLLLNTNTPLLIVTQSH